MQNTINLVRPEYSGIPYELVYFPDGEVQISFKQLILRKHKIRVVCRITNAEELFVLAQVIDILNRSDVEYDILISYLMGMRMDRVMDYGRPFTLKVVANILKEVRGDIFVLEPHSTVTLRLLNAKPFDSTEVAKVRNALTEKYQVVLPDEGASLRFICDNFKDVIRCTKIRNEATGKLSGFKVLNPDDIKEDLIIIDDLCDGGGTFCGIAEVLRKANPNVKLNIFVTHMVNQKGIENLSKTFDHVWFTNSYRDWESLPENVTQIEIV